MKTERRHELQTNVLAAWLGKHLDQTKSYSRVILAVVLLVAAAAIAGTYIARTHEARDQSSWNAFYGAISTRSPTDLGSVAERHPGTEAAAWARQAEADILLADGINALYTSRDRGKDLLQQAITGYTAVEVSTTDRMLKERAWFGTGEAYESLAELDKAREYYSRVASNASTSALGKEAQRRLDELNTPAAQKWYNWFANQKARPPLPGLDRLPDFGELPDLGSLPDMSDLGTESTEQTPAASGAPTTDPPKPDEAESEAPASDHPAEAASPPADSASDPGPANSAEAGSAGPEPKPPAPAERSDDE